MKFKCKRCDYKTNKWDDLVSHWADEHPKVWVEVQKWLGPDDGEDEE